MCGLACVSSTSAQPQIQIAVQFAGVDTNILELMRLADMDILFSGITILPLTLTTTPPIVATNDPNADLFTGALLNSLQTAVCLEPFLGYTFKNSAMAVVDSPLKSVYLDGSFPGLIQNGPILNCATPVCGFQFRSDLQCQVTGGTSFSGMPGVSFMRR